MNDTRARELVAELYILGRYDDIRSGRAAARARRQLDGRPASLQRHELEKRAADLERAEELLRLASQPADTSPRD